uniref:Uncharacterized protein n=1 Tax=Lotharella oceanica TaxID=641309 RepID=A0A7S2TS83_9EUKA|mmetsp:Transcript_25007/g.46730  ORF Transcript_25007/g.46730 Transcript_25007/m.46730 type:complete len:174 (+) Transcript_25007:51-572(+)|eukprot:CAMPEP_0170167752 /NCGR_PEP_ID=MMETSP0040_2-20121228/1064_1 /TAXON_ID=641309 /ORGANISM="Lotharella oceanica, Strain CCMP622" /LENGTH=173 /DNA_ID=CAMNT_0010405871 /DNA_START=37 /DNA_END=558 /DNA_ORIENTATION=+
MKRLEAWEAEGTGILEPPPEPEHLFRPRDPSPLAEDEEGEDDVEMELLDARDDNSSMDSEMEAQLRREIKKMREMDEQKRRYEFTEDKHNESLPNGQQPVVSSLGIDRDKVFRVLCIVAAIFMAAMIIGGSFHSAPVDETTTSGLPGNSNSTTTVVPTIQPTPRAPERSGYLI